MNSNSVCKAELFDANLELGKQSETSFYTNCSWGKGELDWHWSHKTRVSVL